jgi:hypothetical protein
VWAHRSVLIVRLSCKARTASSRISENTWHSRIGFRNRVSWMLLDACKERTACGRTLNVDVLTPGGEARGQNASAVQRVGEQRAEGDAGAEVEQDVDDFVGRERVASANCVDRRVDCGDVRTTSVHSQDGCVAVLFVEISFLLVRDVVRHRAPQPRPPGTSTRDDARSIAIGCAGCITPMG